MTKKIGISYLVYSNKQTAVQQIITRLLRRVNFKQRNLVMSEWNKK